MSPEARLTMLNDMAGGDFTTGLDRLAEWGISDLDLRGNVMGYSIGELPLYAAEAAMAEITKRGMSVFSMSTGLLVGDICRGPEIARREVDDILSRVLPNASVLRPRFIRLLAGQWPGRPPAPLAVQAILRDFPWVIDEYRRAASIVTEAGWVPILENEARDCFLSHPDEMVEFLKAVDVPSLRFTWDVQNQWATGVYPTMAHLDQLAPYVSYYHVKGAKAGANPLVAEWNASLEDSTWPVVELTQAVVDRGLSEVICLNPTQHGKDLPDYDYSSVPEQDLKFLRTHIRDVK